MYVGIFVFPEAFAQVLIEFFSRRGLNLRFIFLKLALFLTLNANKETIYEFDWYVSI